MRPCAASTAGTPARTQGPIGVLDGADDDGRIFLDVKDTSLSVWVVAVGNGLRFYPGPGSGSD